MRMQANLNRLTLCASLAALVVFLITGCSTIVSTDVQPVDGIYSHTTNISLDSLKTLADKGKVLRIGNFFPLDITSDTNVITRHALNAQKREEDHPINGKSSSEDDIPRYEIPEPSAGDYTIHFLYQTMGDPAVESICPLAAYVMLEYVTYAKKGDFNTVLRIYGASHEPRGRLIYKGLSVLSSFNESNNGFHQWPELYFSTFDGKSISALELSYFNNYSLFLDPKYIRSTEYRWCNLGQGNMWGTLYKFICEYSGLDPNGGVDSFIISDQVPIRGVLFGEGRWSSSSGIHNHTDRLILINHGKLTVSQMKAIEESEGPFAAEVDLWEDLSNKGSSVFGDAVYSH
jgi:hypothetical protein